MSKLSQIVFIADYHDPERTLSSRSALTDIAYTHLDLATYCISAKALIQLVKKALPIHPYTLQCHNYYLTTISELDTKRVKSIILE